MFNFRLKYAFLKCKFLARKMQRKYKEFVVSLSYNSHPRSFLSFNSRKVRATLHKTNTNETQTEINTHLPNIVSRPSENQYSFQFKRAKTSFRILPVVQTTILAVWFVSVTLFGRRRRRGCVVRVLCDDTLSSFGLDVFVVNKR